GAGFGAMGTSGKVDAPWQHVRDDGDVTPIEPGPKSDNPMAMCPSGCAHMPIGAWALFIRDQLRSFDGKGQLLKPETYQYLHSAHTDDKYFAGWQITERPWGKGTVFTHSGSNTMNYALAWMAPNIHRAFLVTTNIADRGDDTFKACDDVI